MGCSTVYRPGGERGERLFCASCLASLPRREKGYCPSCGEPAVWPELPPGLCVRCRQASPLWDAFFFHGLYEGKLREMLLALKFYNEVINGYSLGTLLASHPHLPQAGVDAVVPIPLHAARLAERGYNQALELARPLAARLEKPLRAELLARVKATAPQSGNSLEQRQKNTQDAFRASPEASGLRLLLVDDVLTTGATLESACRALVQAGAAGVSVAVAGRTARHQLRRRI